MRTIRIGALLFALSALWAVSEASARDPDQEIIVITRDGAINVPANGQAMEGGAAAARDATLKGVLSDRAVRTVARSLPNVVKRSTPSRLPNGEVATAFDLTNALRITVQDPSDRPALIDRLRQSPDVLVAERNQRVMPLSYPNDPDFPKQWALQNVGQAGGTPGADIGATDAWNFGTGYPLIRIGIVDFGLNASHPDFGGRVTGYVSGLDSHATAVAGIATAGGNNGGAIAGLAWTSPIVSEYVDITDGLTAAAGIQAAVDAGCRIINCSWAMSFHSDVLEDAIAYAHQHNVPVIAALSTNAAYHYPQVYHDLGVVSVAATLNDDQSAPYNLPWSYVDLAAPGGNYDTPELDEIWSLSGGDPVGAFAGTSYAAPHVTGAGALLMGYADANYPGTLLEGNDIRGVLQATARDVGSPGRDDYLGYGRLNVRRALTDYGSSWREVSQLIGGADQGPSSLYDAQIFNVPGLAGGTYTVRAHEVRRTVSWSPPAGRAYHVWGLGSSTGWPGRGDNLPVDERSLFGTGFCEAIDINASGFTLHTWVYEVFDQPGGTFKGWYPCQPSQVVLRYRTWFPLRDTPFTPPTAATSYFTPQAGSIVTPDVGMNAVKWFRTCPDNDGASLPNNARIKIVARDGSGQPIAGVLPEDIFVLFNGGTAVQGFGDGAGADSVIANSKWATSACPNLRTLFADAPTNANGVTYITFRGSTPGNPGVATRDVNRKWGHFDTELPVYVKGVKLQGRLLEADPNGNYTLRIKNFDVAGGLDAVLNQGQIVNSNDFTLVNSCIGNPAQPFYFWCDFDWNGVVNSTDFSVFIAHNNHTCENPTP